MGKNNKNIDYMICPKHATCENKASDCNHDVPHKKNKFCLCSNMCDVKCIKMEKVNE